MEKKKGGGEDFGEINELARKLAVLSAPEWMDFQRSVGDVYQREVLTHSLPM